VDTLKLFFGEGNSYLNPRSLKPANSVRAGTAYIARQWKVTHRDPPKVACAYKGSGIVYNDRPGTRCKDAAVPHQQRRPLPIASSAGSPTASSCSSGTGSTPNPHFYERLRNA